MQDVSVSPGLKAWEPVLRKWFDVLDTYHAAQEPPDVAYWYNERATLSTLAGALWLSGSVVLEEYRTARGAGGPDAGTGRTDMWCRIADEKYTIEAKQAPKLSYPRKPATLATGAETQLAWAGAQCATDDFGGKNRVAMVFMVPSLIAAPTEVSLTAWVDATASFEADVKAHYLQVPAIESPVNKRYFPGVILLGRRIDCAPFADT